MYSIARWFANAVSVLVGAAFFVAPQVAARFPDEKGLVLWCVAAGIVLLALSAGLASASRMPVAGALRFATAPALFAGAGFGCFLIVGSQPPRLAVAAAVGAILVLYFSQLEKAMPWVAETSMKDFLHLLHAVHTMTVFFAFAFAYGITQFADVPTWLMSLAMTAVAGTVAWQSLPFVREADDRLVRPVLALTFALIGGQLYVAFSFLPTAWTVNAAAAAVLCTSALHVCRQIADGQAEPARHRRDLAVATTLVLIVLGTARWN